MNLFTEQALKVIVSIPKGKVLSYGQVARLAGSPRAARQVGWLLRSMSTKYNLPWHRIVNSKGEISLRDSEGAFMQQMLLESEGVVVNNYTLNLKKYLWNAEYIMFDQVDLTAFESNESSK